MIGGDDCDDAELAHHEILTWYYDSDSDGFGSPSTGLTVCVPPPNGYILDATDCDDDNEFANPDASEIFYNDVDEDCVPENDFDLDGDGVAPNGHPAGFGISFPNANIDKGDYFLRTDFLPNRLFRYDGNRWVKVEDSVRITMSNTDTRATQKTGFVNNTTSSTINGLTVEQRQSLTNALKPKADN